MSKKNEVVDFGVIYDGVEYQILIDPDKPITRCAIYRERNLLAYGIGVLKHGDVYNKEFGCRMALRSALGMLDYDLPVKQDIWREYLKIFPVSERKQVRLVFYRDTTLPLQKIIRGL